ncbi:discoidin domain-containing protein [Paenibacillus sp. CMM36]
MPIVHTENAIPIMTSHSSPTGVVSASVGNTGGTPSWRVFDGNINSYWGGEFAYPYWISYSFNTQKRIYKYSIIVDNSSYSPSSWKFQGSNDGTTWDDLDSRSGEVFSNKTKKLYDLNVFSEPYQSFRLYFVAGRSQIYVNEIEMFEYEIASKFLIFNNNKYLTYSSDQWSLVTTNQPDEMDYVEKGMNSVDKIPESAWLDLNGSVEIAYFTDNPKTNSISTNIETTPFTLAEEWQDKKIKIIEYTDDPLKPESFISMETEPFILYDELDDNIDVLYYTDELTKTAATLEYNANYSPLDDFQNKFEVVTWTDESNNPLKLSLDALPVNQFVKQSNDFTLPGSLQAITIIKNASDNAKFLLSFDSGLTWKAYRYGKWTEVIVDDMNTIRKQAMSYKEISKLVESNFKNQGDKVRFGYYIEDKKQESLNPTKIDATQLVIKSNVDDTKFQNLSFYVLNTEATIQLTFNSGKILGQINDEDKGKVQYRVLLNDLPYFPNDGSFTRLAPSPVDINLNISERDMHFDKDNKLRVEFKDYWGNTDYWQTTFAGTYTGLMFMDETGEYLSDTFGGILKYLDFGMIFAGQTTLDQKVVIKNQLGYPIDNLLLEVNKEKLPEGVTIELSRTQSPFLATDYITYGLTKPLETQEFYVRIVADIEAKPVPNGIFELKINSNKAAV